VIAFLYLAVAALVVRIVWKLWTRDQQTTFFLERPFKLPPGALLEVYVNGQKMEKGENYVECDGYIITFELDKPI
jgi:hypothetical protein